MSFCRRNSAHLNDKDALLAAPAEEEGKAHARQANFPPTRTADPRAAVPSLELGELREGH